MRKKRNQIVVAAVVLSTLLFSACGGAASQQKGSVELPDPLTGNTEIVVEKTDFEPADDAVEMLAAGINGFGLNLFAELEKGENQFFSPYSIATAFSILDIGAGGETKEEIEKVFGMEDLETWSVLMHSFLNTEWSEDTKVLTANSIWASPDGIWSENVNDEFFAPAGYYYSCEVFEADFYNDFENVSKQITAWVDKNTQGMIPDYKTASTKNTVMSIINAVFFEGKWEYPFKGEDTEPLGYFRNEAGEWEREVPMMKQWDVNLRYFENEVFQGVELPYKDSTLVMDIILPKNNSVVAYHNLSVEEQQSLWAQFDIAEEVTVDTLTIPAFTMALTIDNLPEILQEMGMISAFKEDADLDKIGPDRYVSDVAHRAKIEVFEEGTRAAAITEIVTDECAAFEIEETIKFIADSPFVYVIRDTKSGIILFMGQVTSLK